MNTYRLAKVVLSLALVLGVVGLMYPAYAGEKCAEKCGCPEGKCQCSKSEGSACCAGKDAQAAKCAEKCGCPEGKCQCGDKEGKCASRCEKEGCGAGKACSNKDGQSASLNKAPGNTALSRATFEGSWSHGAQSSHVN